MFKAVKVAIVMFRSLCWFPLLQWTTLDLWSYLALWKIRSMTISFQSFLMPLGAAFLVSI